jgi:hypothetical protein
MCWRVLPRQSAASSHRTLRSKPRFAASIDEASVHTARCRGDYRNRQPHPGAKPGGFVRQSMKASGSGAIPYIGRIQQTKGVRKFITQKYRYLVYYTVEDASMKRRNR